MHRGSLPASAAQHQGAAAEHRRRRRLAGADPGPQHAEHHFQQASSEISGA
jgi:hypothetical protein